MNQEDLNKYFSTVWYGDLHQYKYSGWALIDKIQNNETILDVGCGPNLFKGRIKNLTGIDPAFESADYKCTIEDFKTDKKFDVAFCLGSINFGDEEQILYQIKCVINLLNPSARIYWRCNPGSADHPNKECKNIDFFPWTMQHHIDYSQRFGFTCPIVRWDNNNRIYAEWSR